jgi:hypothetical protein
MRNGCDIAGALAAFGQAVAGSLGKLIARLAHAIKAVKAMSRIAIFVGIENGPWSDRKELRTERQE